MRRPARYRASARFYDVISAEWPVYRAGRVAAIELLAVRPGEHVLDIGCGTGLNFAHLQRRIGPTGSITGIDASAQMLAAARRRTRSAGWTNVRLVEADATQLDEVKAPDTRIDLGPFDVTLSTYALSLMPDRARALASMIEMTRTGGRVAVVDMQKPVGRAVLWTPLARLACLLGGSDIDAHPWTVIESNLANIGAESLRGGHIQVRIGTVPTDRGTKGQPREA